MLRQLAGELTELFENPEANDAARERWFPRAYFNSPKKAGGHRALADIRESVRELAYYRSTVFVPDPGPTTEEAAAAAAALANG